MTALEGDAQIITATSRAVVWGLQWKWRQIHILEAQPL